MVSPSSDWTWPLLVLLLLFFVGSTVICTQTVRRSPSNFYGSFTFFHPPPKREPGCCPIDCSSVSALLNTQSACPSVRPYPFFVVSCRKSCFLVMQRICWKVAFSRETWCNNRQETGHVRILWTQYHLFDSEYR